uniref:Uncharacterized protein n=1 Tax=Arion vulgaris TaxID=1028688 RepID=A0A0B7A7T3_9EUPU
MIEKLVPVIIAKKPVDVNIGRYHLESSWLVVPDLSGPSKTLLMADASVLLNLKTEICNNTAYWLVLSTHLLKKYLSCV